MKKMKYPVGLSVLIFSMPAFAHEGHGHIASDNPLHYFAEPLHALVTLAVIACIGYIVYRVRRHQKES